MRLCGLLVMFDREKLGSGMLTEENVDADESDQSLLSNNVLDADLLQVSRDHF